MTRKTPIGIFTESIGLYFSNFNKFFKYMSFPVLGQVFGLILIFFITYFYSQNLPTLLNKYPVLNNFTILIFISILIILPGLAIFTRAFWEYLVAYGAINSMLENMLKSGKVYDFDAHTELVKRRTLSFVGLWFLFGIFSVLATCPLFWVICGIFTIYFVLVFQVFTFEPDLSPFGCAKRSLNLVKGHFASTFILMVLVALLTYLFMPQLFNQIFDMGGINTFFATLIVPFVNVLPLPDFSEFGLSVLTPEKIALFAVQTVVAQIVIQYTLPLRSILWSMWYKELSANNRKEENKSSTRTGKRPSEKLMRASHRKYGKKKIDKNILKRAMEKDDD